MKIRCPTCDGFRDRRAEHCRPCRFKVDHPRKGTGADKRISASGYVMVMIDDKECYEHRVVMERLLGRRLSSKEHVHHKNGNKTDNRIENLEVLAASSHAREHMTSDVAKRKSILGHKARWGFSASNL
jgi:hypothetical protein